MRRRGFQLGLSLFLVLAGVGCLAGLWITPLGMWPQYKLARARWQAQHIRHYRMTGRLSLGWLDNGPWTVEVRDERVIAGYHTADGTPLSRVQLRLAQIRLPVSILFENARGELFPSSSLRTQLARLLPPLRRQLDRCAPPMSKITYDPDLGYPTTIISYASPCFVQADWTVRVTELTPLP